MRSLSWALSIALLLPAITSAQQVRGVVVEDSTGHPIPGVQVEVRAADATVRATALTSAIGWFQLSLQSGGEYVIRASHPAYRSVDSLSVSLGAHAAITVVLRLKGGPIPLAPVVVRAKARDWLSGYRERARRASHGRFITRADIDKYGAVNFSEALRFAPEVRIEQVMQGPFSSAGVFMRSFGEPCVPTVFLDGLALPTAQLFDISELLPVDAVEGIEVYRNLLSAPMEFQVAASGSAFGTDLCGVIAVWSRRMADRPLTMKRVLFVGLLVGATPLLARLFQ